MSRKTCCIFPTNEYLEWRLKGIKTINVLLRHRFWKILVSWNTHPLCASPQTLAEQLTVFCTGKRFVWRWCLCPDRDAILANDAFGRFRFSWDEVHDFRLPFVAINWISSSADGCSWDVSGWSSELLGNSPCLEGVNSPYNKRVHVSAWRRDSVPKLPRL